MKDVRPTSSRVLLALFSMLGQMEGRSFLDLFAGTGRVGLEAARRGASSVVFVESVKSRASAIENEAKREANDVTVLSLELRRAVSWLLKREMKFDVIFADPPYNDGWGAELLSVKGIDGLLSPGGVFVAEHSAREELALAPSWTLERRRDYGETVLSFLTYSV